MSSSSPSSWLQVWEEARPQLISIQDQLSTSRTPAERIIRVGQLDAELLDQELVQLLQEPVGKALNLMNVCSPCPENLRDTYGMTDFVQRSIPRRAYSPHPTYFVQVLCMGQWCKLWRKITGSQIHTLKFKMALRSPIAFTADTWVIDDVGAVYSLANTCTCTFQCLAGRTIFGPAENCLGGVDKT